jgi:hypothetical protein
MTMTLAGRLKPMLAGLLLTGGYALNAHAEEVSDEDANDFREDVILCEDAVAHVTACCEYTVPGGACRYYHYEKSEGCGCDSGQGDYERIDVRPVLSIEESRAHSAMTCSALQAKGSDGTTECERVRTLLDAKNDDRVSSKGSCL